METMCHSCHESHKCRPGTVCILYVPRHSLHVLPMCISANPKLPSLKAQKRNWERKVELVTYPDKKLSTFISCHEIEVNVAIAVCWIQIMETLQVKHVDVPFHLLDPSVFQRSARLKACGASVAPKKSVVAWRRLK